MLLVSGTPACRAACRGGDSLLLSYLAAFGGVAQRAAGHPGAGSSVTRHGKPTGTKPGTRSKLTGGHHELEIVFTAR